MQTLPTYIYIILLCFERSDFGSWCFNAGAKLKWQSFHTFHLIMVVAWQVKLNGIKHL